VLVRAATRAGLTEIEARRTVAHSFHILMIGGPNEGERRGSRKW
jgi:hypothetical protein